MRTVYVVLNAKGQEFGSAMTRDHAEVIRERLEERWGMKFTVKAIKE